MQGLRPSPPQAYSLYAEKGAGSITPQICLFSAEQGHPGGVGRDSTLGGVARSRIVLYHVRERWEAPPL